MPRSPCIRSKPQRNKRAAHHIIYSSKKKITLHKVASCGREIKTVPGMICAQEEDVLNKGGEARVRSEHRFLVLVDACEPVADRGWYPPLAVGEAVEDPEFLEEPQEEPAFVALR